MFYFKAGALIGLIIKLVDMKKNTSLVEVFFNSLYWVSLFHDLIDYIFSFTLYFTIYQPFISAIIWIQFSWWWWWNTSVFLLIDWCLALISIGVPRKYHAYSYMANSSMQDTLTSRAHNLKALWLSGADPGFQVRGGALKKIAPSGGRRENFWGISCEKSRFYAKKSYFFQF
jgi:hypothetical protein